MNYTVNLSWLESNEQIDIIVLNTNNLSSFNEIYYEIYERAVNIIAADGAANLIRESLMQRNGNQIPTIIVGDMDSISEETKEYFEEVIQIYDSDQDTTDFQKALGYVNNERPTIVIGDLGGRMDHSLHAISVLFDPNHADKSIYLYNSQNLAFPVFKGTTRIIFASKIPWKYFGMIPLCGPAVLTTEGFKWNFNSTLSEIGGIVSACNEVLENQVVIEGDKNILFTCSK
ncbi:unnamed protein product [Blepharisma stoltei]|uniref:Thiamin pyrophosphokinase thiamin-binding domain-containing protein n=1 Tax=Blepharisma stoltei TaxID=1481888 RepID=A0AAU9ITM8_9CILI|nr:unnamed protein product [Blepharisma stoltei]